MSDRDRWIRWPIDADPATQKFGYGADYNPEQWDRATWVEDVALMRQAGVNIVNLAIFGWALLEPEPGRFEFGLYDEVMDLLHENGIAVDLATGTASPPAWLVAAYPQIRPVDVDGRTLEFGARQSWCASSPIYREHALRLARAVATHFADHPALAMWHVSNEFGCHNSRCYCEVSAASFRHWLHDRYTTLEALNTAWGTRFWSQNYTSWEQIQPPRVAPTFPNPTQQLDFARFSSDELLGQYTAEAAVLREVTPDVPVTTNFMIMSFTKNQDYLRWGAEMDIVSNDHYFTPGDAEPELELAMAADLTRACAGGRPWMLMEASTSAVNWGDVNVAKAPGQMWRNTLSHVGRGADAISYFQWRASAAGAEKYHSAMLPHAGADSRVFREVCEQGAHLAALTEVIGSVPVNDVAILFDWHAWWASELDSHPSQEFRYWPAVQAWYEPFWRAGIGVDIIGVSAVDADLSRYKLVVVPALYLTPDGLGERLTAYAAAGGHVIVTYFSGIVDVDDHIRLGGYPGAFRDLLGVRVEEFRPLRPGVEVALSDGTSATAWTEDLTLTGGTAVIAYADGPLRGRPAVVTNTVGAGRSWYVSCGHTPNSAVALIRSATEGIGVTPVADTDGPLELARRTHLHGPHAGTSYLFAINHGLLERHVRTTGTDLLSGTTASPAGEFRVPAGETLVIRQSPHSP